MKVVYFTHSLSSCWNHGNAHFLRGILRELVLRGHAVVAFEPKAAWSLANLLADQGESGLAAYREAYPELKSTTFDRAIDFETALDGADLVIVHEWNEPWLVEAIGRMRAGGGRFILLFHDTHHRAVSDPNAIRLLNLDGYDGVLAFGEALAEVYRRWGWGARVHVFHEAADTRLFHPPLVEPVRDGLVWIGNWGDDERSAELEEFLFRPAQRVGLPLDVYGVRYPEQGLAMARRHGASYRGWLPNARAPAVFARHRATIHVPRRFYSEVLPGIPTIRVFEALSCGIPLISAPWRDSEGLFRPGHDFLVAGDGAEMERHLSALINEPDLGRTVAENGLRAIRNRHTCAHRVDQLLTIFDTDSALAREGAPA
jgi:spore maturation protein CgeB